jgi:hypothetical protein
VSPVDGAAATELRKIGNVLALLLVRDMPGPQKIATLSICGFSNKECAAILGITEGAVRTALSRQRKSDGDT